MITVVRVRHLATIIGRHLSDAVVGPVDVDTAPGSMLAHAHDPVERVALHADPSGTGEPAGQRTGAIEAERVARIGVDGPAVVVLVEAGETTPRRHPSGRCVHECCARSVGERDLDAAGSGREANVEIDELPTPNAPRLRDSNEL